MRNQPFKHLEIKELPKGYNSSGQYPNRRVRRMKFVNTLPLSHLQVACIKDKKTGEYLKYSDGTFVTKVIKHYKTPPNIQGFN